MQKCTSCTIDTLNYEAKLMPFFSLQLTFFQLPPANEVCEGYVFTCVCLSRVSVWGLCPGVVYVPGCLCPGALCPDWSLSRAGLCSGWVSVQGGLCHGDPPITIMCRAVCILLECILVYRLFSKIKFSKFSENI